MIEVILSLNYTPNKLPQDLFSQLCEKSYTPLIAVFHELFPVVHCFSGRILERLHTQNQEDFLGNLKNMVDRQQAILATKGFTGAAFSKLSKMEILHQLGFAHEITKEIFGQSTNVFMPEEGWIDVYMPGILKKAGFQCALLSGSKIVDCYKRKASLTKKVKKMRGLKNSEINIISSFMDHDREMDNKIKGIFSGKTNPKNLVNDLYNEEHKDEKTLLFLNIDAELPFLQEEPRSAIQRFRFFLECLHSTGNFHFSLPQSIIERTEEKFIEELFPSLYCDRRLELLTAEAKALNIAAEKKEPSSLAVRKAWKNLLFAHDYCFEKEYIEKIDPDNKVQYSNVLSQYIQCCERAQLSIKNALEV